MLINKHFLRPSFALGIPKGYAWICLGYAKDMPRVCLGYAKSYQSIILEVNKRVYLEGPYLKTHCEKATYYFSKITDPACVG